MLDPDNIRATGERVSRLGFVGMRRDSLCCRGEGRREGAIGVGGTLTMSCRSIWSHEASSGGGGAAGNLKLEEKEPDGFRVVTGRAGVLGAVVTPGLRRGEREGNGESLEGSRITGGETSPLESGEGWVAERWPGEVTADVSVQRSVRAVLPLLGYEFGLPGMTCKLADLPCPLGGRRGVAPLSWLASVAAFVPSEMMDSDRPGRCCTLLLPSASLGDAYDRLSPACDDVCSDKAGRWPRACGGGTCEANDELRDTEGLVDECTGGSLRCRSPPWVKPFCLGAGERAGPSTGATFLKVIVHSMSSPANTVESFHCTNTRMFDADMVGARMVGAAAGTGAAFHRVGRFSDMTATSQTTQRNGSCCN